MQNELLRGALLRVGVSALALTLMTGAVMAEDEPVVEEEPVVEDTGEGVEPGDDVIWIDDACIDCSGIPVDGGEEPVEYLEDGEVQPDEGEPVPDDGEMVADDGEVVDEPDLFPTSNCGGCEAWSDKGDDLAVETEGRPLSMVYRIALCSDPAFDHLEVCEGLVIQ
jgi:hypothetical protein